ncbi:hypothetical protein RclHR1_20540004 [Rhizophagus clarus]|uniref:Uncharacterized protein n=1 Tax=Rhizophagus clarus TaxID=94130 RepID=A0A2Z6R438_9GLOM|nr:hypothetical protein RclHR1_20540004 [Rhizophagus clarus]
MGWSWVQLIPDAGYLNSVAIYAHGTIRNWPSSTRAEAAAIYAALRVSPDDSTITIYTDSQAAIDGHDGNYWNEFTDSLVNSTHHSDMASLLPAAEYTSSHNVCLVYDNIVLDWELTWFTLNFFPAHDASFQASHAAWHYAFKFKLFLDDLPLLEKLKITRSDLYIDLLTCCSCRDRMEDLMHLILSGELADMGITPLLRKLSSLSCWTISSSNWSSYALIRGCLPTMFIDLFVDLSIPRQSAMKVVAAIHNNFIQKLRKRI